ncbi:class I adenylate-forming enzyme family protein [Streptomyces sp. BH106]|uniref:class I adenylate-forming enzyme family protein n=1 Tax=Streptomyces sp. BH106 TaxID=3410409 RepID=UPI003CF3D1BD
MTLFDHFRARAELAPDDVAIVHGEQHITYGRLLADVDRLARGLHTRGIDQGDRVLSLAGNIPDVVALYLAVSRIGAVYVPVSTSFREREVRFVLENSAPKLAFVDAGRLDDILSWTRESALETVVFGAKEHAPELLHAEDFGKDDSELPAVHVPEEAGLLLCYTSGTTSRPKPVLHSQRSEIYNATTYAKVWDLGPGDRGVVCLPLAWVYGLSTTTAALLVSGGTVLLLDRFHPVDVLDTIETHRATAMWGTMSMYTKMLEVVKERDSVDLSCLRVVNNGGEPCPPPLVAEFEKHTGLQLLGSYATSEARPIMVVRPGDTEAPTGTVGQLVPEAEIRIEAPDGAEVLLGQPGHALLRCPGLMTAYYGEPELTAERLTSDGWLKTGDLLQADSEGYFFVVGRQSEMIIRSGANIAPAEVESALAAHPRVVDAAVVGVPDPRSGESVRAVVVTDSGTEIDGDEIRQFVAAQLAAYKVPAEFIFVDELPRTDRGKVDRLALRTLERA